MNSRALAGLLAGLALAGCAATTPVPPQPGPAGTPPAPLPLYEERHAAASLDARFRQFDDHYATIAAETRQRIQEALAAVKQAPTAADVAALKAATSRLEAQVTRLTAATTRTDGVLTGLTARIETAERAHAERPAKEPAAAALLPSGDLQTPDAPGPPVDTADASFVAALAALTGPQETTEPIRTWLGLHPTHPEAAEGYLQLGFALLDRHQPVMAAFYLKHLIDAYPMHLQAQEAKSLLASLPPARAPKPKVSPKKTAKPSAPAGLKPAAVSPSPKDGNIPSLSNNEATTPPAAPAIGFPALPHHGAEPLGSASSTSTTPSPVVPRATNPTREGAAARPPLPAPPLGPPPTPAVPAGLRHDHDTP